VKVTENTDLVLPICPKCGAEDAMEHVKTEYHNIETHYDECVVCGYRTDPE
jgi:Zn ribbon nucleic-acid-binding protein